MSAITSKTRKGVSCPSMSQVYTSLRTHVKSSNGAVRPRPEGSPTLHGEHGGRRVAALVSARGETGHWGFDVSRKDGRAVLGDFCITLSDRKPTRRRRRIHV